MGPTNFQTEFSFVNTFPPKCKVYLLGYLVLNSSNTSITPIVRRGKNYTFLGETTAINESDVHALLSQSNTPNKYPVL